jgi:hypothetical protein
MRFDGPTNVRKRKVRKNSENIESSDEDVPVAGFMQRYM